MPPLLSCEGLLHHQEGESDRRLPGPRSKQKNVGTAERLQALLASFQDRVDGVRGIAIADKSGLSVSSSFATKANILTVTAMATMAIQSSHRAYQNLGLVRTWAERLSRDLSGTLRL